MPKQLSVIITGHGEFPQSIFTIQSIIESLDDKISYELIYVDNKSIREHPDKVNVRGVLNDIFKTSKDETEILNRCEAFYAGMRAKGDYTGEILSTNKLGTIKYIQFDDVLSHWEAKNVAMKHAEGDVLFFTDAHMIMPRTMLLDMYNAYINKYDELNGSLHLPIRGFLGENQSIYKVRYNKPNGELHYVYTNQRDRKGIFKVPAMIGCSLMVSKKIFEDTGCYPKGLKIWGGGEHAYQFTQAVLGYNCNVYGDGYIYHWAGRSVERGYTYNMRDYLNNRAIALYIVAGEEWLRNWCEAHPADFDDSAVQLLINLNTPEREALKAKQVISIEDWIEKQDQTLVEFKINTKEENEKWKLEHPKK